MAWLALAAALALAWQVLSLWLWPWKPCPRCHGGGRNPGSNERRHGDCKRCGGSRRVRRPGARLVHQALPRARRKP